MDASKFGFQPNIQNLENYMKENQSNQSDGPQITWWSIPQGMSSIRIMPPWDPTGRIALCVHSHNIEYQGSRMKYKKYNWTCVGKTFGKKCNICEGLQRISAAGINTSEYEPNRRTFYINAMVMFDPVYDRDLKSGKKPEQCDGVAPGTLVVMRCPKTIYDWAISSITNPLIGDITSVTNGCDVYITKDGSGLSTTYTATLSPNGRTAIPQEYLDKIDSLYNLDEIFSTGFDDEMVNGLIDSLNTVPAAMQQGIPTMMNQMGGYTQATPTGGNPWAAQQPMTPPAAPQMPSQQPVSVPGFPPDDLPFTMNDTPAPPNPWAVPQQTAPQQSMTPPAPTPMPAAPAASNGQPECFGQYDPGSVKCVTCSMEIACQGARK